MKLCLVDKENGESLLFYYYGRKKKVCHYYPPPRHRTIIEPFAGSASYSCYGNNWEHDVILIEKDERVADIWKWLIHSATPESILSMPNLIEGQKTSNFFHILHSVSKMAFRYKTMKVTSVLARNWEVSKRIMAKNLYKVKHWKIICADYQESPNITATWFIDPPYQFEPGMGYEHNSGSLNYKSLSRWVKSRKGDVIACEGDLGDYLPFLPLVTTKSVSGKRNVEKVYCQSDTPSMPHTFFDLM